MKSVLILAPFLSVAYGHGLISAAVGANGVTISGFGVTDTVPRNGTSEQPFQLDTPVMKNLVDDPCGATLQGGSINIDKSFQVALAQGKGNLPSLAADGSITMTIHQVNADGGGPYLAQFNTDGTGKDWQEAKVTQQVPGAFGIVRGGPVDSQFTAQLPAGTRCTGGPNRNACLVRINNGGAGNEASLANGAGPFGGCVAVTAATGGNNTNNGNTNTNTNNNGNNRGGNRGNNNGNNNASQNNRGGRNGGRFRGNQNQGQNRNQAQRGRRHQRDFAEAIDTRKREEFSELLAKRRQLDAEINIKHRELVERQLLTADLIDEIKTATGSAIDIPIDAFAGQVDANPNGGNSTTGANAILTIQQSFDLKKAVQGAIEAALSVLSSAQGVSVDAPGFGVANKLNANDIDQANREAEQALKDGSTTSVNQGNAGVGEPNTSVINELLGAVSDIRTLTLTTVTAGSAATATAAAGGVTGAPSASVTATPAGNANGPQITAASGRNRNRNRRNGLSRLEYVA